MLSLSERSANRVLKGDCQGVAADSQSESSPISSVSTSSIPRHTIVKDDLSDFTVDKWRNKIFTDPRVRSKLKDRNYRVKIIEDVELTRAGVLRLLPKTLLESLGGVIAIGTDTVLFNAEVSLDKDHAKGQYAGIVPAVVKVWHKPAKQLMESKKPFYEEDTEFMEKLSKSPNTDFRDLWAEREMKILEKLAQGGVKCPKGIACVKNVLIMSSEGVTIAQHEADVDNKYRLNVFHNALSTIKLLYTHCGLVHADLSEKNMTNEGTIYDVYRVIAKLNPDADDLLYKTCNNFYKLIKPLELKKPDGPGSMFFDITGNEYKSKKPVILSKVDSAEMASRKMERKSERSKVKNNEST